MPSRKNPKSPSVRVVPQGPLIDEFHLIDPEGKDFVPIEESEAPTSKFQRFAEALADLEYEVSEVGARDQTRINQYLDEMSGMTESGYLLYDNQYEALRILRDNSLLKENSALKRILGIQDDHVDAQTAAGASRDDAGQSVHVADTLPASEPDEDDDFSLAGPEYVAKMKQKTIDIDTKIKQIRPLLIRLHEWVGSFSETGEFAGVDRIEAQKIADIGERIVAQLEGPYEYGDVEKRKQEVLAEFALLRKIRVNGLAHDLNESVNSLYRSLIELAQIHKIDILEDRLKTASVRERGVSKVGMTRLAAAGAVAALGIHQADMNQPLTSPDRDGSPVEDSVRAPADLTSEQGNSPESSYSILVDSKHGTQLSRAIVQEGDGISDCLLRYEKDKDNSSPSDDDDHDFPADDNLQGTGLSLDEVAKLLQKLGIDETRGLRKAAIGNYAIGWEQNGEQPELKIYRVARDTSGKVAGFEPEADRFIEQITYAIEK